MKLVAATQNKHKLEEIYKIIKDFDMELVPMNEAGLGDLDIEETGTTLEENSLLKAQTVCDLTGCAAVADAGAAGDLGCGRAPADTGRLRRPCKIESALGTPSDGRRGSLARR